MPVSRSQKEQKAMQGSEVDEIKLIQDGLPDELIVVSRSLIDSLEKKLEKADEINEKMLSVILHQSEHIRYLEKLNHLR